MNSGAIQRSIEAIKSASLTPFSIGTFPILVFSEELPSLSMTNLMNWSLIRTLRV